MNIQKLSLRKILTIIVAALVVFGLSGHLTFVQGFSMPFLQIGSSQVSSDSLLLTDTASGTQVLDARVMAGGTFGVGSLLDELSSQPATNEDVSDTQYGSDASALVTENDVEELFAKRAVRLFKPDYASLDESPANPKAFETRYNEYSNELQRFNADTNQWEARPAHLLYHIDQDVTFMMEDVEEFMRVQELLERSTSNTGVVITRQFAAGTFVFNGITQKIVGFDNHAAHIITVGAPMIGPVPTIPRYTADGVLVDKQDNPITSVDIVLTGSDAASRAADTATNTALLRQRYGTIIEYTGGSAIELRGKNGGTIKRLAIINTGNGLHGLTTGTHDQTRTLGAGARVSLDNVYFVGANSSNVITHYGGSIFIDEHSEGPVVVLGSKGAGFQAQYGGGTTYIEGVGAFSNATFGIYAKNGATVYAGDVSAGFNASHNLYVSNGSVMNAFGAYSFNSGASNVGAIGMSSLNFKSGNSFGGKFGIRGGEGAQMNAQNARALGASIRDIYMVGSGHLTIKGMEGGGVDYNTVLPVPNEPPTYVKPAFASIITTF